MDSRRGSRSHTATPQLKVDSYDDDAVKAKPLPLSNSPRGSQDYSRQHLSMAFVAYPFKKSADGYIEQFIHSPALTPAVVNGARKEINIPRMVSNIPRKSFNPSFLMESVLTSEQARRDGAISQLEKRERKTIGRLRRFTNKHDSQVQFKLSSEEPLGNGRLLSPNPLAVTARANQPLRSAVVRSPMPKSDFSQLSKRISCQSLGSVKSAASGRSTTTVQPGMLSRMGSKNSLTPQPGLMPLDKLSMKGLKRCVMLRLFNVAC